MKIVIAGGTGFIGSALIARLRAEDYEVTVLTRTGRPPRGPLLNGVRYLSWDPFSGDAGWHREFCDSLAAFNFAGEPVAGKRWTRDQKREILQSRVLSVRAFEQALRRCSNPPAVMISASAIGYYGAHEDESFDEHSSPGKGFLAEVARAWEEEALKIEGLGIRLVRLRLGVVLGKGGGALSRMLVPFRTGMGGSAGSGRQWLSWIHEQDLTEAILFLMRRTDASGAFNLTAPHPVRMNEFVKALGRVIRRPAFLNVPGFLMTALLGDMAQIILQGQRVVPKRLLDMGFRFEYPELKPALENILSKPR